MIEELAKEYISLIPNIFESFNELNNDVVEISHMQNHVIEYLYMQDKALNLKEISTGLNVAKQQITLIVKELEIDGYVTKTPDLKDKRAVLVSLTSKGKEVQDRKWMKIYQKFSHNLAKLSEEEHVDLKFALHKANLLLKKMVE